MSRELPRVTEVRDARPDDSITRAIGRHHNLETALADLVDNSIDADASHVVVRFLQSGGLAVGLQLIDDGQGMDADAIDRAMTFAHRRDYGERSPGHFGLGLKAASLSQADVLGVLSRSHGAPPVGRMIRADAPTAVSALDSAEVDSYLSSLPIDTAYPNGTVVEWREPRTFISSPDIGEQAQWLDERIESVRSHLGTTFQRLLADGRVDLKIEVFDVDQQEASVPRAVSAVDPFGYDRLQGDDYPQTLWIALDGVTTVGTVHIWPAAQSGRREFRLHGKPGTLFQGLYFYRHDRLVQQGGWNTLVVDKPELEYARIEIDLDDVLGPHAPLNPEKAGLELDSDLKTALRGARVGSDRQSFTEFLESAQSARRDARQYTKRSVSLVRPDRGFDAEMLDAFEDSVELMRGDPVHIRWQLMTSEAPFSIDLERRTVWLNEQYRAVIVGPNGLGANHAHDAPLVKTLLMIVFSKYFTGSYLGSHEKLEVVAWEQLLTAALRDELGQQAARELKRSRIELVMPQNVDGGTDDHA